MFLSKGIFKANALINLCVLRRFSSDIAIVDKWKRKLAGENISEIDSSIKHILDHVRKSGLTIEEQSNQFEKLCECRVAHMPVQYIIGEWDFCDLILKMVPPVFIPRPETEELVELIFQQCDDKLTMRFMEIGCGSGAISLAMLKSLPKAQCIAIDQSDYACKLTAVNATKLALNSRMIIIKHKLTEQSDLPEVEGKLDLIVSNPPYIPTSDLKTLAPEISLYEDLRALDGGQDGLNVIKAILSFASKRLALHGHLWLEVHTSHPKMIESFLNANEELNLKYISSYKDMFDRDRFVEIMKA